MLEHLDPTPQKPSRVVVLGAYGFVGGTCARLLAARAVPVLPLDKDDIDLMASGAAEQLQMRLAPDDAILVVSARAPCKDTGMMVDNIRIMHAVCTALERRLRAQPLPSVGGGRAGDRAVRRRRGAARSRAGR